MERIRGKKVVKQAKDDDETGKLCPKKEEGERSRGGGKEIVSILSSYTKLHLLYITYIVRRNRLAIN